MSCTAALVAGAACLPAAAVRRPRASSSSSGAPRQQRLRVLAGAGFGSSKQQKGGSSGGSAKQKQPKLARYLETETVAPGGSSSASADDGWVEMPGVEADKTFISKPIKPLILATGRAVCLYKVRGALRLAAPCCAACGSTQAVRLAGNWTTRAACSHAVGNPLTHERSTASPRGTPRCPDAV